MPAHSRRGYRWALRLAGVLVLAIAVGHAFLPTIGYPPSASAGMTGAARDHFYYLGTYAIGAFLLGFAVLTLMHSARPPSLAFPAVMTAVWAVRLALELAYPVDLRIFVLDRPTVVITPVLLTIAAAFATATAAARKVGSPYAL
jgi:hypothetical protein